MELTSRRSITLDDKLFEYTLVRKSVKNLNLHVRRDGSIYVSAHESVPESAIEDFVISKETFIVRAIKQFQEQARFAPQPKQYISGETFVLLGRNLRLKVIQSPKEQIYMDGVYIFLEVKDVTDAAKRKRMVCRFLDKHCKEVFSEILEEVYPIFQKYGVLMPTLRIRNMDTRWGSCLAKKGIITLNRRLTEAPRSCIEYVVMHECCHFVYPNHSKQFYAFLSMLMPDWKKRKRVLEEATAFNME